MDETIGDLTNAELIFEDDKIVAVGRDLGAEADETIDAGEMIVMPGFVNAHMHCWQPQLRAIGSEWMSPQYMTNVHSRIALHYQAEDNYLGALMTDLAQIDGGTTTVFDWSHNIRDLEMAERAIDGHEESGIRCVTVTARSSRRQNLATGRSMRFRIRESVWKPCARSGYPATTGW
jgi:5-methylthioadenosine/S-adenosylhomocysteine deaminase